MTKTNRKSHIFSIFVFQDENYDDENATIDTNQSFYNSWHNMRIMMPRSQTPTNNNSFCNQNSNIVTTPTNSPDVRQASLNRQNLDAVIQIPSASSTVDETDRNLTTISNSSIVLSNNSDSIKSAHMKRNGVLKSGGVPLAPLSVEIDPHAWDLPEDERFNDILKKRKYSELLKHFPFDEF